MSDRIAVMHRGRIEQVGAPEDLYDRPATSFVADFIGTTNLLSGTIERVGPGFAVTRFPSGDLCHVATGGRRPGESVQVSVRPESIVISAAPANHGAEGGLNGIVEQVAYLGASVQYHVRTAGELGLTVLAPRAGPRFGVGDAVHLDWQPSDALILAEPSIAQEDEA